MFQRLLAALFPSRRAPAPGRPPGPQPPRGRPAAPRGDGEDTRPARGGALPHTGGGRIAYAPERDGDPDPGEIVWAWVPYEEDASRGKDRPLLLLGYAGDQRYDGSARDLLLAVMLSSKDHDGDRDWVPIGTGAWDRQQRPSSVRIDRLFAVPSSAVRREGAVLDRARFETVAGAARAAHGLS
jgi:hypothetical protein